jgi:hypothetical protein
VRMWYPSGSNSRGSRAGIGPKSDAANLARMPLGTLAQPCGRVLMLQLDSAWQMPILDGSMRWIVTHLVI